MTDKLSNGLAKADELANGLTSDLANDNELIKALEICSNNGDCRDCKINPHTGNYGYCTSLAIKAALDLIKRQRAEIKRLTALVEAAEDYLKPLPFKNAFDEEIEKAKSEVVREFAEKIDQLFDRYAHILSHADCARKDYIKTDDGTEIEMQTVWDVFRLEKHGIAEYEEMNRLQENIELIEKGRLLAELKNDFRLLVKEMTEGNNAE